ncbi:PREDICTED: uncharacterized protein LOC108513226 isoform X2 [Rhinopithecus bieti]|uniref:uncharacterized protein LOC108513226 isoform X2 n=1 Tax=Rhinopithecus bieti TaxID=61621 RepID=UPI00083BEAF8|nr:PREDICTED: uncharacterized protein LOC108513226 isoform X2 [Rhinopithecus bieti]
MQDAGASLAPTGWPQAGLAGRGHRHPACPRRAQTVGGAHRNAAEWRMHAGLQPRPGPCGVAPGLPVKSGKGFKATRNAAHPPSMPARENVSQLQGRPPVPRYRDPPPSKDHAGQDETRRRVRRLPSKCSGWTDKNLSQRLALPPSVSQLSRQRR